LPRLLQSLRIQILSAITILTALFAASTLYSLHVIDQQHSDDVLVQLAGRLQFNQQHFTVQAMRYKENAPRDYQTYFRDVRLYFEDLKKTRHELSAIIEAFAENSFDSDLIGETMAMPPRLPKQSLALAGELHDAWNAFGERLDERIGADLEEPRLEWAAQWIVDQHGMLEQISERLFRRLASDVSARAKRVHLINRILLITALLVSAGIAVWFYRRVLAPLAVTVDGFKRVANGDFDFKVPVSHDNEIGWLASSFNHLAGRMDALRTLLTRLEQGDDLEGTLHTLSETLPALIPVDWIGLLIVGPDGRIHLERAFSDGEPDPIGKLSFEPDLTLLEECIQHREPLHIPDVREMSQLSDSYVFLRRLAELGRRDAIFMPIYHEGGMHGVAVFASRYPNNYRTEHLALLRNLGNLIGYSLGRTIQLAETARLASIGQFASGIVHEIRNPLATISLALDHLKGLEQLPKGARKRTDLAAEEVVRLERLLSDILLYAKPLALDRIAQDISVLISETLAAKGKGEVPVHYTPSPCAPVAIDADRIRQVLINLLQNAQQASPPGEPVQIHCRSTESGWVEVEIVNQGEPIPSKSLERVFEPFVTSKSRGTGLGLPIVQRIVNAHGGEVSLHSESAGRTRALLRLPVFGKAQISDYATDDAGSG